MKTSTKIFIGIGVFVTLFGLLKISEPSEEEKEAQRKEAYAKAQAQISKAYSYSIEGKYDSALVAATIADSISRYVDGINAVQLKYSLERIQHKESRDSLLASMSDQDYEALKQNKFSGLSTFSGSVLDDSLKNIMFTNLSKQPDRKKLRAEWLKSQEERKKAEIEYAKMESDRLKKVRVSSQQIFRNDFLDRGLDIKVAIKGKNKDHLYLQFALFNDVWFRRFETEGFFEQYHKLGFQKVTLTDGYDYNKFVYWE